MLALKVKEPIVIPTAGAVGPTWEQLAQMLAYLHLMWGEIPADQLFRNLEQACREIATGKRPQAT